MRTRVERRSFVRMRRLGLNLDVTWFKMAPMQTRHGGNLRELSKLSGRSREKILDFSANMNPLGPPGWLRLVINRSMDYIPHYPDPGYSELIEESEKHFGLSGGEILVGNGSSELLYTLMRVFKKPKALIPVPSYVDYAHAARHAGCEIEEMLLRKQNGFQVDLDALGAGMDGDTVVILGQPNNPTGTIVDPSRVRELAGAFPECEIVVDEAFADFVSGYESLMYDRPPNVTVLYSMTKFFAIPGLRLGLGFLRRELRRKAQECLIPWSVNVIAEQVGIWSLRDREYVVKTRALVDGLRRELVDELTGISALEVFPGQANFLLVRISNGSLSAGELADKLLALGIAIRTCHNYSGLDERYFRIAVRNRDENRRLLDALRTCFSSRARPGKSLRKTPAVMFQGTGSNAGKSVLTAGLCRILVQDGYRVAPFKAQNMSLNSYVTEDGREMGRAQVLQAEACGLKPDVRMNPILLKPNTDKGSQVVLMGKPYANLDVMEYHAFQNQAFEEVKRAYFSLSKEFDAVVLEGAGSCGEVNLKKNDIVNMRMADLASSAVLVVGDIDRGGVFASFVGHMDVMEEWERKLVGGFVVNRFRGDADLLAPAFRYIEQYTGKPTFGVVPFLHDLGLPEEDSVTFKQSARDVRSKRSDAVSIVVVSLPHISNFTDIDPLCLEPDVNLRIVDKARELGRPDLVILPGSKNVIADLVWLQQTGLADGIKELVRAGGSRITGICGGFQMLGLSIRDPHAIESNQEEIQGMGLCALETVLAKEKTLKQVDARHVPTGLEIRGYEIHHGQTEHRDCTQVIRGMQGQVLGITAHNGNLLGTYLHGLFDKDAFRRWFLDDLRARSGFPPLETPQVVYDLNPALDRLADVLRGSLDLQRIKQLMGLKA